MTLRTCPKCGGFFEGFGTICDSCRKPKTHINPNVVGRPLTFREKQVVALITTGQSNKAIAHELLLSEGTIKVYVSHIFDKVGVTNRTELAVWAYKKKLEEGDDEKR
jgi:DNA-binding NarL/FixJ family response regulator